MKSQNLYPELLRLNRAADSLYTAIAQQQPVIGISASRSSGEGSTVSGRYVQAILQSGGTPVIIPVVTDGNALRNMIKGLDGLIMTGGGDVAPLYYGENTLGKMVRIDSIRDVYDMTLLKLATDRNIPVLGICRGEQLINVAFGGTLYQDIPIQYKTGIAHFQKTSTSRGTHVIEIVAGTKLAEILVKPEALTNSFHHQGVKDLAFGFRISARSADGFVEAIEGYPNRTVLGVQFHPEGLVAGGDTAMLRLFKHIVNEAGWYRRAKMLHQRILTVDAHSDTPSCFKQVGFNTGKREANQVNLPKMEEGMLDAVFFACRIKQGTRDEAAYKKAVANIYELIDGIYEQVEKNKNRCGIAIYPEDAARLKNEGKKAIFIGMENGYGLGKNLSNLALFQKMGVNYVTLCHTENNEICDSSTDTPEWNGLSDFGRQTVKEMNRLGMLIDVSHASDTTFYNVIRLTTQPIVASHSAARALCSHPHNLSDEQLKALAKNGGVAQVCLRDAYLGNDAKTADLTTVIRHIDHIVKVAGIHHVGIGSDFDGGGGVTGCNGSNDLINITVQLLQKGYSEEDIAKIMGGNFLRVLSEVQGKNKK
ncbi:MAG: membrane dipeptidase [Bacteroidales bacterium]|nr:membrane dipeptidase [Bacteroidales bacterium]